MGQVVLVIHLLIAIALVGVIMVQRSEGGGLGIGGGGGGLGGLMTSRGSANLLTRATGVLAGCFMFTSITLAMISGGHTRQQSIIDTLPAGQPAAPAVPAPPAVPAAPVAQ